MSSQFNKVLVVGLDSAEPSLLFDKWINRLPTFQGIMENGIYGKLRSTIPPITVPAWMSMMTGKTPGDLGIYGFRNKEKVEDKFLKTVDATEIKERKIWDIIAMEGKKSIINGVPLTFPVRRINGNLVSCFMTPSLGSKFTYPVSLQNELIGKFKDINFDVKGFRRKRPEQLNEEIREYTKQQFDITEHLIRTKKWDFAAMVEMGTDRVQHAFWHYMDKEHVLHNPDPYYKDVILNHYKYVDSRVKRLIDLVPDDTLIIIVSDHGAKRMDGGFCINEWLIERGYLVLKSYPKDITSVESLDIDWVKTRAYAFGGYYGRLFINEEQIPREQSKLLIREIKEEIENMKFPQSLEPMMNRLYLPADIYPSVKNYPPQGIVYINELNWRVIGSVGHKTTLIDYNDTGLDGSNHSQLGIFMCVHKKDKQLKRPKDTLDSYLDVSIYDITPTIIDAFNIKYTDDFTGKSIFRRDK